MDIDEIADQLFARIGCFDIAQWLGELARTLELELIELMPVPAVESKVVTVADRGLTLTLHHPHAGYVEQGDPARWVLTDAEFALAAGSQPGWPAALPLGIDKRNSTRESMKALLGEATTLITPSDIAAGDLRETYVMNDGRAIEVTWSRALTGIDRLHLARLGRPVPFAPRPIQGGNDEL